MIKVDSTVLFSFFGRLICRNFTAALPKAHRRYGVEGHFRGSLPKNMPWCIPCRYEHDHVSRIHFREISSEPREPSVGSSSDSTEKHHFYKTPATENVFSDVSRIECLTPRQLRVLLEDAIVAKVDDVILWSKAASYCIANSSKFKFFDALSVLNSFGKMNICDKTLLSEFSRMLVLHVPQMEPRHFVQAIDSFAMFGMFPEVLFLEIFYGIMKQSEKMHSNEYVDLFLCLSRWDIHNQKLLSTLCRSLAKNVSILRYPELTQIMAAVRSLKVADETFYFIMDSWQQKELAMMTFQELFDACKKLRVMTIKWEPYEFALFEEFVQQSKKLENNEGINQLADPFDCLNFLRLTNALSKEYLFALSKWCANAVYNPPTRSQKRPLSHQLVQLYKLVEEYDVDDKYIDRAVLKFVTSKGGLQLRNPKPIPTVYKPSRKYIYAEDPINPRKSLEIKFLQDTDENASSEQKEMQKSESPTIVAKNSNKAIEEMEPYPKWIDKIKFKKPSTHSCGKASFRLKPKTVRIKNVPVKSKNC